MKARITMLGIGVILALVAGPAVGQSPGKVAVETAGNEVHRIAADGELGPAHNQLAKRVGKYSTVTRLIPQPGVTAIESSGTALITSVLGGRFLMEEDSGTFMEQPSAGLRLWGYNTVTREYEACWTYTMSTAMLSLTGTSQDGGKTVNFAGGYSDEYGARQRFKVITRQVDNDHFAVELISQASDGKPGAVLTTTYTRTR
jgi:hypothetical protein